MKVGIILHEGTERQESLARALHALLYAKELKEKKNDVRVIFDGAGTLWIDKFEDPDFKYKDLYDDVKNSGLLYGACEYCSQAFGVTSKVKKSGIQSIGAFMGHPSLATLLQEGYQIITL